MPLPESYKEKLAALKKFMPEIIESVKKDLKNDHLRSDWAFGKKYFGSKNPLKLTTEELIEGYSKAIQDEEQGEKIAEFVANRWIFRNSDVYYLFEKHLQEKYPNFQDIKEIDSTIAENLIADSSEQYGFVKTYLFSFLNAVVFSDAIFEKLRTKADHELTESVVKDEEKKKELSFESLKSDYETKIARLTDKYEKKLAGLERKYFVDTEGLKKQLSLLQKKLQGAN